MKKRIFTLPLALAMVLSLVSCGGNGGTAVSPSDEPSASPSPSAAVPVDDGYDTQGAVTLTYSDSAITGEGEGFETDGTALTIKEAGTYVLTGSCADGSVKVKKGVTGVTLVLSGLDLTSADTAPILCAKSSAVTIVAAAGTVNTLADSARNNDDEYPENENAENAVIKCKDGSQITLRGSGTLEITANGKNGIKSGCTTENEGEAWMLIRDLTLTITAPVNDAINAEQLLTVESGCVTIDAADDGVHCDRVLNIGTADGDGPGITITRCEEGLEGATLNILSGSISIHAEDDCLNAANSDLPDYPFAINISGGSLVMDSADGDGIDSNGKLTISGGTVAVWTANAADNQPLDADGLISVTGGTVLAAGASSGMGMRLSAGQPYVTFGSADFMAGPGQGGRNGQDQLTLAAGASFEIQSADGTSLYSGSALTQARWLFFSSPALTDGESCTLLADGVSAAQSAATTEAIAGNAMGGWNGQMPGRSDGGREPPELPEGGSFTPPDGQNGQPPELPDGQEGQPPELPDGQGGAAPPDWENGTPPAAPGSQPPENSDPI